eukprot:scaffold59035_cov21-Tisochrysis_lutea.AAC.1
MRQLHEDKQKGQHAAMAALCSFPASKACDSACDCACGPLTILASNSSSSSEGRMAVSWAVIAWSFEDRARARGPCCSCACCLTRSALLLG